MVNKGFNLTPNKTTDLNTVMESVSNEEKKLQETIEKMKKSSNEKAPKVKKIKTTLLLDEETHTQYKMYLIQNGGQSIQKHLENLIKSLVADNTKKKGG
jgi:hypothetical protein